MQKWIKGQNGNLNNVRDATCIWAVQNECSTKIYCAHGGDSLDLLAEYREIDHAEQGAATMARIEEFIRHDLSFMNITLTV